MSFFEDLPEPLQDKVLGFAAQASVAGSASVALTCRRAYAVSRRVNPISESPISLIAAAACECDAEEVRYLLAIYGPFPSFPKWVAKAFTADLGVFEALYLHAPAFALGRVAWEAAAAEGCAPVLEFMLLKGGSVPPEVVRLACKADNVDALKWALAHVPMGSWDQMAALRSCKSREALFPLFLVVDEEHQQFAHQEVLRLGLLAHGVVDLGDPYVGDPNPGNLYVEGTRRGDSGVPLLQAALAHGAQLLVSDLARCLAAAAEAGHLAVLEWFFRFYGQYVPAASAGLIAASVRSETSAAFWWLLDHGVPLPGVWGIVDLLPLLIANGHCDMIAHVWRNVIRLSPSRLRVPCLLWTAAIAAGHSEWDLAHAALESLRADGGVVSSLFFLLPGWLLPSCLRFARGLFSLR